MGCKCSSEVSEQEVQNPQLVACKRRNTSRKGTSNQNHSTANTENEISRPSQRQSVIETEKVDNFVRCSTQQEDSVDNQYLANSQDIYCIENEIRRLSESQYVPETQTVDNFGSPTTQQEDSTPGEFRPLKDRYFGPSKQVTVNELIANLIFSGWKLETQYKKPNIINIPFKSEEGQTVLNIFNKTSETNSFRLVATGISRIENVFLYAMYLMKKEEMKCRNRYVDELNLFHGTKKENVKSICDDNFDWRRYGKGVGNKFGKGVSFTPKATYAMHYCDKEPSKVMFLAKVLVSKAIIGDENMSIPVDTTSGKIRFNDTSVKPNIDVVVKYGDNEFYPAYRIMFRVKYKNM